MAKSFNPGENKAATETANDNLTSFGAKFQKNRKPIIGATIAIMVVVAAVLVYVFAIQRPAQHRAAAEAGLGYVENMKTQNAPLDSAALVKANKKAEDHLRNAINAGHDGGNIAALKLAEIQYENGKYQDALNSLGNYSPSDNIMGAAAMSLKGDCYVNLDKLDDAVAAFKNAISVSDANPYYTPFFMMKLARVYDAQKKYSDALAIYQEIYDKYPQYFGTNIQELEKLIAVEKTYVDKK